MAHTNLSSVTNEIILAYGNTARNVINAWRAGGDRVVGLVERRWEQALEESRPQLSAEVQANARHMQSVVGSYYAKGMALSTAGADAMVDQFVKLAGQSVAQAAANASLFEEKTGVTALRKVSAVAVPAVAAVGKIAAKVEEKSVALVGLVAGGTSAGTRRESAFHKARARKAA